MAGCRRTIREHWDLALNADSLTEMGRKIARRYLDHVAAATDRFLSINHEVNEYTVNDLLAEMKAVHYRERFPYWLRRGYVEETAHFAPRS